MDIKTQNNYQEDNEDKLYYSSYIIVEDEECFFDPATKDQNLECSICQVHSSKQVKCDCDASYCSDCLENYFKLKILEFDCFETKCPGQTCTSLTKRLAKFSLSKEDYNLFVKIEKKIRILIDPQIKPCPRPDCQGVSAAGKKHFLCNQCKCEFVETLDPGRLDILKRADVVECPRCKMLLSRRFGCLVTKCICGYEFCAKCNGEINDSHFEWKCSLSTGNGKLSWLFIALLFYFPVILPFSPALFVAAYHYNWDRKYFYLIDENPGFYLFFLWLFSPLIFVFGLFLAPFVFGGLCVRSLVGFKSWRREGVWMLGVEVLVYFPAVFLSFIGLLLLTGLVVCFSPLLGATLFVAKLVNSKY